MSIYEAALATFAVTSMGCAVGDAMAFLAGPRGHVEVVGDAWMPTLAGPI